jgi:ABC-type branched-subunit amino acid transport system permease subunit
MTVEKLFSLLAYALVLSVVNAAMYKRYSDCEELPMVVFFTFIIILLIIMLALMINMPLLAALGVASFFGLAAYYAIDEKEPHTPSQS